MQSRFDMCTPSAHLGSPNSRCNMPQDLECVVCATRCIHGRHVWYFSQPNASFIEPLTAADARPLGAQQGPRVVEVQRRLDGVRVNAGSHRQLPQLADLKRRKPRSSCDGSLESPNPACPATAVPPGHMPRCSARTSTLRRAEPPSLSARGPLNSRGSVDTF